jgi:hypothetical protein
MDPLDMRRSGFTPSSPASGREHSLHTLDLDPPLQLNPSWMRGSQTPSVRLVQSNIAAAEAARPSL